jgi:hypothetical protein
MRLGASRFSTLACGVIAAYSGAGCPAIGMPGRRDGTQFKRTGILPEDLPCTGSRLRLQLDLAQGAGKHVKVTIVRLGSRPQHEAESADTDIWV